MHEKVKFAINEIDAAVYSGDLLAAGSKDRATLVSYAIAWLEELEHKDVVARAYELGQRFSGVSVEHRKGEPSWPSPFRAYLVTSKEYAKHFYGETLEQACQALLNHVAALDAAQPSPPCQPFGGGPLGISVPVGKSQAAVETCWKCGRDVKFGIRHGEHQCDRVFLEERLRSFVGHVVNQMMVSGEKVTIDPMTLGEVAGRVAKMYVDDSDREYPKVEIDCDAMLRAMGRIRVTVWFTKRAPDDTTCDVAIVYPRMNGVE